MQSRSLFIINRSDLSDSDKMVQNGAGSDMENFESKRKQLFACLDQAAKELKGPLNQASARPKRHRSNSLEMVPNPNIKKFRGKESIFKKPELPLIKCLKPRVTPDYQVNPHKWKKYSLGDVDISDRTNTSAAFAFLKEIEAQKEKTSEDGLDEENDGDLKPVFNKSLCVKKDLPEETPAAEEQPKLKGAVLVMPEYRVGQKAPKAKKRTSSSKSAATGKQLTLAHLMDEEEDDD